MWVFAPILVSLALTFAPALCEDSVDVPVTCEPSEIIVITCTPPEPCTPKPPGVYAFVGTECRWFEHGACQVYNVNCANQMNCLPPYKITTDEATCVSLCEEQVCPCSGNPPYLVQNADGDKFPVSNDCELQRLECITRQEWIPV